MADTYDAIVVGAGAAGHFAVAEIKRNCPDASVLLLEKSGQCLAKVRISGGGRCNVTHHCFDPAGLLKNYPRGNPWLEKVFRQFSVQDTLNWFGKRGVKLLEEPDGRMFPESNSSSSIVNVLQQEIRQPGVELLMKTAVKQVEKTDSGFQVCLNNGTVLDSTCLLVCSGGHAGANGLSWLSGLGLKQVSPVPSLFTFNVKDHPWKSLMGLSCEEVGVSLPEIPCQFTGPVLVTHWGFSGPAVLKSSAAAARELYDLGYQFPFLLDFLPQMEKAVVLEKLNQYAADHPKQKPINAQVFQLPRRLWEQICMDSGLAHSHNWAETGRKSMLRLVENLKSRRFEASGKTTFKEEFVTAGGISLDEVDPLTCESTRHRGLFFAGEVLDVDGFTGGFNFQAAWSTAYAAGKESAKRIQSCNQ